MSVFFIYCPRMAFPLFFRQFISARLLLNPSSAFLCS